MSIDHIEEVNKNIDNIEHVEKFNPFHDARGRFASARGMASFSANPKTKAGAMAIGRSTAAGYGAVMNVHRESKGENIRQNDNWIKSGQKPNKSQLARAQANAPKTVAQARQRASTNRVKGTMGATEKPKWMTGQNQQAKQTAQAQAKPTQSRQGALNAARAAAARNASNAQATAQPNTTPSKNGAAKMVDGKDISGSFKVNSRSKKAVFDQVCEQQGFTGKPQLVDKATFHAAEKASGIRGYRTWHDDYHGTTTAQEFKKQLVHSKDFEAAGSGGRVYGGGTYVVTNSTVKPGAAPTKKDCSNAWNDSRTYGGSGNKATATVTLDPSAKIADYNKMSREFNRQPRSVKNQFGGDVGAYAASKGYDAMTAKNAGWGADYTTVFNRTKLIVLDD